jgi:succinate dehydrogenase flavin-adding protein (antitoxin of CptAB toxin-antitoxin module)
MMRLISILTIPFFLRFQSTFFGKVQESFVFPEGCRPNISDTTTYESRDGMNETELDMLIEKSLFHTLENTSHEEIINFDDVISKNNRKLFGVFFKFPTHSPDTKYPDLLCLDFL